LTSDDAAKAETRQVIADLERKLADSVAQQAATSEILRVISQSPTDVRPVFDAIVLSAVRLFRCDLAFFLRCDGNTFSQAALVGSDGSRIPLDPAALPIDPEINFPSRTFVGRKNLHLPDWSAIDLPEHERRIHEAYGINSSLFLPLLLRGGECFGLLALASKRPRIFGKSEISLAESFRDQAVIAIENAQLFNAVQAKTRDLEEALRYQTGSANILNVIASSPTDVNPVLKAIVESACELCEAYDAVVTLREGDHLLSSAHHGPIPMYAQKRPISRGWTAGRAFLDKKAVHVHDLQAEPDEFPFGAEMAKAVGYHSIVSAPLLRGGEAIGAITLRRLEVHPFSEKQILLLQTFANQAVIAISNVNLFEEVQERTRDLTESLQQQTATAEVLRVISGSPGELRPVFNSMLQNAVRICDAQFGNLFLVDGDAARWEAGVGTPPKLAEYFMQTASFRPTPGGHLDRVMRTKEVSHSADDTAEPVVGVAARLGGARSTVCVPMVKDDTLVGTIFIYRTEVRPFTDKQIDLVKNFAAQAVIAIENARLLNELRQRTDALTKSLEDLRAAQDRLIQTEKLASLGQLTAGIAHEIKNPLNFVNNFSALSVELTDELNDVLEQATLADKIRADVDELTGLLKDNLGKVVQHGKRADSIVKNMLLHSREGSGERRSADINALVGESLNLAYHGARAEKPGFTITLTHDLDPNAGVLDLYPQEITRALLNLISNGFYAATRRKIELGDETFEPLLSAATRDLGETVEIRIRDNGTGISPDVKAKMFNPFFTTKPTGEGTGLGLSMTHDIVVKQHGGRIDVETEPGGFTEFIITLPRGNLSGPKPE
jgi:two-component system, NtrC family, sensor kinase